MKERDICWYCGGKLIWQSDFNYDEVHHEGEGIVSFLTCSNCGAELKESDVTCPYCGMLQPSAAESEYMQKQLSILQGIGIGSSSYFPCFFVCLVIWQNCRTSCSSSVSCT